MVRTFVIFGLSRYWTLEVGIWVLIQFSDSEEGYYFTVPVVCRQAQSRQKLRRYGGDSGDSET